MGSARAPELRGPLAARAAALAQPDGIDRCDCNFPELHAWWRALRDVGDQLTLGPQGELVRMRDAGPVVMMRLPPGVYTLEATWKGRTERRTVHVGSGAETVNWREIDSVIASIRGCVH